VSCTAGTLTVKSLITALKSKALKARLAGGKLESTTAQTATGAAAVFSAPLTVSAGQELILTV